MSATLQTLPPDGKLRAVESPTAEELRALMPAALLANIRNPPPASAWCGRCGRTTPTSVVEIHSDIFALCASCRARRGRGSLGRVRQPHCAGGSLAEVNNGTQQT